MLHGTKVALSSIMKTLYVDGKEVLVDDEDFDKIKLRPWRVLGRYAVISHHSKQINWKRSYRILPMHRVIMQDQLKPGDEVDHIDGNGLNNCRSNLRICQSWQNKFNRGKQQRWSANPPKNQSKYKGVSWNKLEKRWQAIIGFRKIRVRLLGSSEENCAYAYNIAAKKLAGEFAYLNPVPEPEKKTQLEILVLAKLKQYFKL